MTVPIDSLAQAFAQRATRLAVFDIPLRRKTGQWRLDRRVPVSDVIDVLSDHEEFLDGAGRITIPLHETDSAELTEEYMLIDTEQSPPTVIFYDLGTRENRSLPLEEIEESFPAWRVRFWTDKYPVEEKPTFVHEFGELSVEEKQPDLTPVQPTPSTPSPGAIIEAAREELAARRSEERERRRRAFEHVPIAQFIEDYGGIFGCQPAGRTTDDFGQQSVLLSLPDDHPYPDVESIERETRISPGDIVIIDSGESRRLPVEAEVFDITTEHIELGVYWDTSVEAGAEAVFDANEGFEFGLGVLVDGARYAAIEAALGTVERTDRAAKIFAGHGELTFGEDQESVQSSLSLNRDQRDAINHALAAESLSMVRTPPGTGARRVLWTIMYETVQAGGRVCLLGPDAEMLDRLIHRGGDNSIVSLGSEADIAIHQVTSHAAPPSTADIVVAPLSLAAQVDDHDFELAILDHAARVSVPSGSIPFAKARRIVLVGDPMQSPADHIDRAVSHPITPSIWHHMHDSYGDDAITPLRCQYRMNQAIALYPNREFYDGQLIHGQENREWSIEATDPIVAYQVPDTERMTPTGSAFNEKTVQAIIEEIGELINRGVSPESIGILTPSSAEVGKIRAELQSTDPAWADGIMVGQLDQFTCRHRGVMIVSFVKRGDEVAPFWTPEGLNVALTRAERRLVLFGDWESITHGEQGSAAAGLASFLQERSLIESAP